MKLQVYERNVYGRSTIYPTGEEAPILQALTGRKTLDMPDLRNLQHLGFEIAFVPDPNSAMAKHTALRLSSSETDIWK
jgi:hypothetical protein